MAKETVDNKINVFQMQSRAKHLWGDNNRLENQIKGKQDDYNYSRKKHDVDMKDKVERINELEAKIELLKKDTKGLFAERKKMNEIHQNDLKQLNTRHLTEIEDMNHQITNQEEKLEDINHWLDSETDKVQSRNKLRNELERLQAKHGYEMSGIKREKGIQIDKLRKEMLQRIREVKSQMLSLNEE